MFIFKEYKTIQQLIGILALFVLCSSCKSILQSKYSEQSHVNTFKINYPSKYNFKQTSTYCGPFSTAAVVRILTLNNVNSFDFAERISWKISDKGTLPFGLQKQLKKHGIKIEIPNLKKYSDKEKVLFLQERLSQGKPIIILGEKNNYQHYLTLLGFDKLKDDFFVYDSWCPEGETGLVVDENNELPGNINLSSKKLLDFWRKGGMHGFYKWYAIVSSKQ